ncbi:MAG: hypothetical protein ABIT58_00240 [Ferruginibacter sp.]
MKPFISFTLLLFTFASTCNAQYKDYKIGPKGDTINAITKDGLKTGKWVMKTSELRGNPGFEEEGMYKKNEKDGLWRKYNMQGDLLAVENFVLGGKDGLQQYYNYLGDLETEEMWKGYNPDSPYDTIAVYGTGSGEIIDYKIVKAEPYSVKDGEWKFYEPGSGRLLRTEQWQRNNLVNPAAARANQAAYVKPKKVEKTDAMIEWERKNRGKKNAVRDGHTGM